MQDLDALGLVDIDNSVKLDETRDYFEMQGTKFDIINMYYDGYLDQLPVLLKIKAKINNNAPD